MAREDSGDNQKYEVNFDVEEYTDNQPSSGNICLDNKEEWVSYK